METSKVSLPVVIERLNQLKDGLDRIEIKLEDEVRALKTEHILDLRANICRLWLAVDRLRDDRNIAVGGLRIIHWIIGGTVGALGTLALTYISKHF